MEKINMGFVKCGFYRMPANPQSGKPDIEIRFERGVICWYGKYENRDLDLLELFSKAIAHKHQFGERVYH